MPITIKQALAAQHGDEFWHMSIKNADGTPMRARVTGRCRTWATRPNDFMLPLRHGLRNNFHLIPEHMARSARGESGANQWCTPENWPAEHVLFGEAPIVDQPPARWPFPGKERK